MTDFNFPDDNPNVNPYGVKEERYNKRDGHLTERWYATPDLEVGGWVVVNSPKTHDEMDYRLGEVAVANFLSRELAEHIAVLHNRWLMTCRPELSYHADPHRGCILR